MALPGFTIELGGLAIELGTPKPYQYHWDPDAQGLTPLEQREQFWMCDENGAVLIDAGEVQ